MRFVYFLSFLAVLTVGIFVPQALFAQIIPRTCNADVYTTISARAQLGIAREMEAAERIIRKPDSTLEYSCFGLDVLDHLAVATNALFSDDQDADSMDQSLDRLILEPMDRYLDQNFWHVYLGGSFPGFDPGVCNAMAQVWFAAKCDDFDREFLMFGEMPDEDPRVLPSPCDAPDREDYMDAVIAAAYPVPGALGGMDILDTFQAEMVTCDTPAVPTGVRVRRNDVADYDDAVCIAPGCYHNRAGACVAGP